MSICNLHVQQTQLVPVELSVIDTNGNERTIGTTTSDSSGTFSYQWTPDITGKYTVTATFAGTNSYWPSYSETTFAVDPATSTPIPLNQLYNQLINTLFLQSQA